MATKSTPFKPYHLNATPEDFVGNEDIGRYMFLPGSDGRAQEIAKNFESLEVKTHPRGHNLYFGNLSIGRKKLAVGTVATGMGCPSMEIILHELFYLGAKRFLRVGTAGSLQPWVKVGDIVNAQASVRDEATSSDYIPLEVPAIASLEMTSSILITAEQMRISNHLHTGVVHCKSSFYAREFLHGPRSSEHKSYIELMIKAGILASEMETAALFIQSQIYNHQLQEKGLSPHQRVLAGAVLAIIGTVEGGLDSPELAANATNTAIQLGIESIKTLATQELFS